MTLENWITLAVGFGGVVLGGTMTFISEIFWKSREAEKRNRANFQIVLHTVLSALEDLENSLDALIERVQDPTGVIASQIREISNFAPQPISIDPEILFSISTRFDQGLFSETNLFLKRHTSTILGIRSLFVEKNTFHHMAQEGGHVVSVDNSELATIEFSNDNHHLILQLAKCFQCVPSFFKPLCKRQKAL